MNTKERHEYAKMADKFSRKFLASGKYEKAEHLMQKAIHFAPELAIYYNQYGVALICLGRFKEAKDCFSKAINLCSASGLLGKELMAHIYHNRGACFFLEEAIASALSDTIKATELSPKEANLWQQKSCILLRLGNFAKALESAEIAIMLDGGSAYSRYLCALAHLYSHNFRESLEQVEVSLGLLVNDQKQNSAEPFLEIKKRILEILRQYGDVLPDDKAQTRVLH